MHRTLPFPPRSGYLPLPVDWSVSRNLPPEPWLLPTVEPFSNLDSLNPHDHSHQSPLPATTTSTRSSGVHPQGLANSTVNDTQIRNHNRSSNNISEPIYKGGQRLSTRIPLFTFRCSVILNLPLTVRYFGDTTPLTTERPLEVPLHLYSSDVSPDGSGRCRGAWFTEEGDSWTVRPEPNNSPRRPRPSGPADWNEWVTGCVPPSPWDKG